MKSRPLQHDYYKLLSVELIQELLQAGADINAADNKAQAYVLNLQHACNMCYRHASWHI